MNRCRLLKSFSCEGAQSGARGVTLALRCWRPGSASRYGQRLRRCVIDSRPQPGQLTIRILLE